MKSYKYIVGCAIGILASFSGFSNGFAGNDSGLVLSYRFERCAENYFYNTVESEQKGTVYGATVVDGISGNALHFDGIDDYLQVNEEMLSSIDTMQTGTISFWFKSEKQPGADSILPILYFTSQEIDPNEALYDTARAMMVEVGHGKINNNSRALYMTMYTDSSGKPGFCVDTGVRRRHVVSTGQWHNVVFVVTPFENRVYYDGEEITWNCTYHFGSHKNQSFFLNKIGGINTLLIGRGVWFGDDMFFKGAMDEINIYSRQLSAYEIFTNYYNLTNKK